jgi:hypothetical protein
MKKPARLWKIKPAFLTSDPVVRSDMKWLRIKIIGQGDGL